MNQKKVFIFGIDGASPELIFDKWLNDLPNIRRLMNQGCYAKLNSTIPPSTIIAWNSMISGKDASEIGIFGYTFKDKEGNLRLVDSKKIKCDLIWDIIGKQNKKTISLYVPLSFPVKPIKGCMVSGFLTPNIEEFCAYPEKIKEKIKSMKNSDIFFDDISILSRKEFKIDELIKKTYEITEIRIELLKDLLINEEWDLFISVIIGTDLLQHMIWRHFDETHRRFIKNSPYKNDLKNYYIYLDKKLGEILEILDENTTIIVCSDHGMIKQEGKININNWLINEGYLVLKKEINFVGGRKFNEEIIDMKKTTAYASGKYYAKIFINKEKVGKDYGKIRQELINKIKNIPDDKGNKIDTKVYKSDEVYKDTSDPECPDLIIYLDNLKWASNPDLKEEGIYSWESEDSIGADNAGHSRQGCFIIKMENIKTKGYIGEIDIKQVAPTLLKLLNLKIPQNINVKPINVE